MPRDYDDRVLALLSQGLTRKQIAEHMGTTKSAICGKIWRLQKSGYVPQPDSECPILPPERKPVTMTEMERRVLVRLAAKDDMSGREIANADWPKLEEMASWQAIRDLERKRLIFRGARDGDPMYFWAWRITGCARLLIAIDAQQTPGA